MIKHLHWYRRIQLYNRLVWNCANCKFAIKLIFSGKVKKNWKMSDFLIEQFVALVEESPGSTVKESTGSTEDLISPGSMISFLDAIGDVSNLENDVLNDSLFINDTHMTDIAKNTTTSSNNNPVGELNKDTVALSNNTTNIN